MRLCTLIITALVLGCVNGVKADGDNTIYDPNPKHLWNRLNETLFERTAADGKRYGLDELDILYWYRTENLLTEPSHRQALAVLDEFIRAHGEKEIRDPLKRAWLQRDLWTLFDMVAAQNLTYAPQRKELEGRLAVVIRRLGLTTNEIAALPDNYARTDRQQSPDLPRGLFETNGDWVSLSPDLYGGTEIAPNHDRVFGGHSAFLVLVHLPNGIEAARDYLSQLRSVQPFWIYVTNSFPTATNSPHEILTVNTNLPEFPANTEWALVRRLVVVDADGNLQPTRVIESLQMRRYLSISKPDMIMVTNSNGGFAYNVIPPQKFFEFETDRRQNGALRELAPDEKRFFFGPFFMRGSDPFETTRLQPTVPDSSTFKTDVLQTCRICHASKGIYSIMSYTGRFPTGDVREPPQLYEADINREMAAVMDSKRQQFNWGLLQGLWRQGH